MSDVYARIAQLSPDKRKLLELLLDKKRNSSAKTIAHRKAGDPVPLSFAQQRIWFLDQLQPGSAAFNLSGAVRVVGRVDVAVVKRVFHEIVRRHEGLRTTFEPGDREPVQVIKASGQMALPVVDLTDIPEGVREDQCLRLVKDTAQRPFDLAEGPLFRPTLFRLAEQDHVLLLTLHHIVCDGWSVRTLIQEVAALYDAFIEGRTSPLPELPIQYGDFAIWQRQQWAEGVLKEQLAYWKQQLAGASGALELPADRPRPVTQSFESAAEPFLISSSVSEALRALSQRERVTLFMTLLAAFQALLHFYTGQKDIIVGSPVSNRRNLELEPSVGLFINMLCLRVDLSGNPTFAELLGRCRAAAVGAYSNQDLPFEKLVEELQPVRDLNRPPLIQVMFLFGNAPTPPLKLRGLTLTPLQLDSEATKFDLTLSMVDTKQGLESLFIYKTDLFDRPRIARMASHFQNLLQAIVSKPRERLSNLGILSSSERQQLLYDWNDAAQDSSTINPLLLQFETQAKSTQDTVGVLFEDEHLTYAALNERTNQVANYLHHAGIRPESLVGICLERTSELVIAVLGVLKAGAAYLPLDPSSPKQRLAFMLKEGEVQVVLTREALTASLPDGNRARVVCLDSQWDAIARYSRENPTVWRDAGNLAYVIYTSGSTGKAKGVMVEQRQLLNYVCDMLRRLEIQSPCHFAMLQPLTVDSSITMLYPALVSGGCLQLISRERALDAQMLGEWFLRHPVDYLKIAPSHLAALHASGRPELLMAARYLVIGGEGSHWDFARALLDVARPGSKMMNHYGPTETTVGVLTFPLDRNAETPTASTVPLGRPIYNTQAYVLDEYLHPLPVGVPGELYIGGDSVARGYMKQSRLTARQFVPDPFGKIAGARLYRTGDLCRYLSDGNIEFLGRIDDQVKIRGFRVEPGEIEAALGQCPAVRDVVVLPRRDAAGQDRLVAYVVPERGESPAPGTLRAFLAEKMPEYMIPSSFVLLPALPLAPHGKVDRQALPALDQSRRDSEANFVAPQTPLETLLASIWAEILGIERAGARDDFFALGGHSLLATRLISRVRQACRVEVPLRAVFESPTVAGMAEVVERAMKQNPASDALEIRAVSRAQYRVKVVSGQDLELPEILKVATAPQESNG